MCTHWTTDRHLLYSFPFEPLKQRGVQFYIRAFLHFFILHGQHHYHSPLQIPQHLCCFYLYHIVCTMRQLSLAYSVSDCPFEITSQCTGTRNGSINKMAACTMSLQRAFLHTFTVQMMGLHNIIEITEDVVHINIVWLCYWCHLAAGCEGSGLYCVLSQLTFLDGRHICW